MCYTPEQAGHTTNVDTVPSNANYGEGMKRVLSAPFDFPLNVSAAAFYNVSGKAVRDAHNQLRYRRLVRFSHGLALIEIRETDNSRVDAPEVTLDVLATRGEVDYFAIRRHMQWILSAEYPLQPFYNAVAKDRYLSSLVLGLRGLRAFRLDTMFESLVVTLIEQQIALSMAQNAERWLMERYGERLDYDGEAYYTFPLPATIATLTAEDLAPTKITFIRINRILEIARTVANESLQLEAMTYHAPDALYKQLMALNGVGHWTAAWTMLRATGHYLYVGSADVALRSAVNMYLFHLPGRSEADAMDAYFHTLRPYDGIAAFYVLTRYAFDKYIKKPNR
jgi:DNA-3-methyladenine glycosylase II